MYANLLLRWNRTINLVGRADEAILRQRHIEDCLRLVPFLPVTHNGAADLGSGAGLPGLVLALVTGRPYHLIEADERKAAFLAEAARLTAAPVTIHARRIEAVAISPVSLITARALAPLSMLLRFSAPLLQPDGECLFLKGTDIDAEIAEAKTAWSFDHQKLDCNDGQSGPIVRIQRLVLNTECGLLPRTTDRAASL